MTKLQQKLLNVLTVAIVCVGAMVPAVTKAALTDGLVAYYSFDGRYVNWQTGTLTNQGTGGGSLTLNSLSTTTTTVAGIAGQGFYFASTTIPTNVASGTPSLTAVDNWTMSAWMKPQVISRTTGLVLHNGIDNGICGGSNCTGYGFGIGDGTGQAGSKLVGLFSGVAWIDSGYTFPAANQWYFVVMQRSGGTTKFYVNGVQQSGSSAATPVAPSTMLTIGGQVPYYTGSRLFNGVVDEVRMYNRVLTLPEITQLYAQGKRVISSSSKVQATSTTVTLSSGLIGYWTMDGKDVNWSTNTIIDRSGNNNTGTFFGMSTTTSPYSGVVGQSLGFDGVNTYISLSNLTNINTTSATDARTISAWIKTTQGTNCIFCVRNNSIPAAVMDMTTGYDGLTTNAGRLMFLVRDNVNNGMTDVVSSARVDDGKWHFVVAAMNSSKVMQLYVDGVASGVSATHTMTAGITGATTETSIGKEIFNSSITPFKGQMDDVRIYTRALSATEIYQLYKQGSGSIAVSPRVQIGQSATGLSNGLVGYWTMDGRDTNWMTNTMIDRSGGGNTGTIVGLSTTTSPILGKIGQAFSNFSLSKYISIAHSSSLNPLPITISFWVNTTDASSGRHGVLNKYSFNSGYTCHVVSGVMRCWYIYDASNYWYDTVDGYSAGSVADGKWHHIVLSLNGTTGTTYNNGVAVTSGQTWTGTGQATVNSTPLQLGVGSAGGSVDFVGSLDDMRIYNRALSATEVLQLYKQGSSVIK